MKFLKRLLILIVALVVIYCIMGLFGPSDYKVERTKEINAPIEVVFEQVSKFNNWDGWSPWKEKDSTASYTIAGEDGMVGTKYEWTGNPEITGKGSMTVTEMELNKKFGYDLEFTEPWQMKSKGHFELSTTGESTTISWVDAGDIPFMQRPMMLFMDLDEMMGPDFERGLFKIDSLSQIAANEVSFSENISEVDYEGATFIGVRHNLLISEIDSSVYGDSYAKIMAYCMENGVELAGAPSTITTNWDLESDSCSMLIGMPVNGEAPAEDSGLEYMVINPSKAVLYAYYGDYNDIGTAYMELETYTIANEFEIQDLGIEVYVTDPATVESKDEILTNVYFLLK